MFNRNASEVNVDKWDLDFITSTISSSDETQKQALIENIVKTRFDLVILIILRRSSRCSRTLFHKSEREDYAQ